MTHEVTAHVPVLLLSWLLIGAAGCGSEPEPESIAIDPETANASARWTATGVVQAVTRRDGAGGLSKLVTGALYAYGAMAAKLGVSSVAAGGQTRPQATCVCSETSCVFDACGTDGAGGVVLDGSISWTSDRLHCEGLRYVSTFQGTRTTITFECDVTVSNGIVKGSVSSAGTTNLASLVRIENVDVETVTWSTRTTLNDVAYGDTGVTGGSAELVVSSTLGERTAGGRADVLFR